MKRIMLRMVAFEGGELTRRRVPIWEFEYPDAAENERVKIILDRLLQVRLIVGGKNEDSKGETESYVEPAHDALIVAWDKLLKWRAEEAEAMLLQRQLTRAAADWEGSSEKKEEKGLLWDNNPRLLRTQEILREKRSGTTRIEKRGGLFRGMKQFCRVLFPSYKDLHQYIWLNQTETDFVRRSIERKRNWTWSITGIVSVVIVALTTAAIITSIEKNNAAVQAERADKRKREVILANYTAQTSFVGNNISKAKWFQAEQGLRNFDSIEKSLSSYEVPYLWRSCNKNFIELDSGNTVEAVFMPRKKSLLTGNINNKLIQWDALTGLQKWVRDAHEEGVLKGITTIDYCSKTNELVTAGDGDSAIKIWNPETGYLKQTISLENLGWRRNVAMRIQFSLDGRKIAVLLQPDQRNSASGMSTMMYIPWKAVVLDAKTGKKIFTSKMDARSIAISPDGKMLAAGKGRDINIFPIDAANQQAPITINLVRDYASSLAFSPDGNKLAIGGNDVTLWDINENRLTAFFKGHPERILDIAFSSDGELLASASQDSTAKLWNIKQLAEINTAIGHHAAIRSITFSNDSKLLATASADGTTRIWDIDEQINKWATNGSAVAFSKDSELMVSWDDSMRIGRVVANDATNTIKIVDTLTWREYASGKFSDLDQAVFSHRENILALGSNDKWHLVDTKQMKNVAEISAAKGMRGAIGLFHPETANFFIIDKDHNLVELDTSTGKTVQRIAVNSFSEPKAAVFLHKGKFLAIGDQLKILLFNTEDWTLTKEVAVT
ncbi:MAG: WD40 repeat domain-containing protein, partial [Candidatus Electrothrix sp. AX5]|nr:WD40 repeat domain-containing protein [Candidatus Electrothrix sp. AX5]